METQINNNWLILEDEPRINEAGLYELNIKDGSGLISKVFGATKQECRDNAELVIEAVNKVINL